MKPRQRITRSLLAGLCCLLAGELRAELWVTGYYPAYKRTTMPPANIDFTTVTHLIHFAMSVNPDGSLNATRLDLSPAHMTDVVGRAHAAGRKVLICAGGADSQIGFRGATSSGRLTTLISNLTQVVVAHGYDGVDLDWEPMNVTDTAQFTNLVHGLRSALDQLPQPNLLTAAVVAYPPYGDPPTAQYRMFASLQNRFDQINVMTYDLSGPWPGWVTWFNAPVFDGGYGFPGTGALLPSMDGAIRNFLSNGVTAAKLGAGIPFYGYLWTGGGVSQPRQAWPDTSVPVVTTESFATISTTYFRSNVYHWDNNAQSASLAISNGASGPARFISYDDPRACQAKVSYARNRSLGGVMIWELTQDYFPAAPVGQRHPLLQSINEALASPGRTTVRLASGTVTLTFTGIPLGSYRVQWTDNLSTQTWNTLVVTNIIGPGGSVNITDPRPISSGQRFYRVQSPP